MNNTFYTFPFDTDSVRCHRVTIKNFKKVAQSVSETDITKQLLAFEQVRVECWIEYLKKTVCKGEVTKPTRLSLIERLM